MTKDTILSSLLYVNTKNKKMNKKKNEHARKISQMFVYYFFIQMGCTLLTPPINNFPCFLLLKPAFYVHFYFTQNRIQTTVEREKSYFSPQMKIKRGKIFLSFSQHI